VGESAADFERRHALLGDWNGDRSEWRAKGVGEIAFTLEALGATPDGFERVLRLAHEVRPDFIPAGLCDVAAGRRIGVSLEGVQTSGEPLGQYLGVLILAWTTTVP
jgi:hypothetical protein